MLSAIRNFLVEFTQEHRYLYYMAGVVDGAILVTFIVAIMTKV